MATVLDLLSILNDKLGPYPDRFVPANSSNNEAVKIRALDAGKEKVWLALVAASKKGSANWFAQETTANITSSTRSGALPADCHDVLGVHLEGVPFRPSAWHKQNWRDQREDATVYALADVDEVLWLVHGNDAPVLEIGPKLDTTIAPTIFYVAKLATWSSSGSSADDVPSPYYDAIVNYACWSLSTSLQDPAVGSLWWNAWQSDREMIQAAGSVRQQGGVVSEEDYDSRG